MLLVTLSPVAGCDMTLSVTAFSDRSTVQAREGSCGHTCDAMQHEQHGGIRGQLRSSFTSMEPVQADGAAVLGQHQLPLVLGVNGGTPQHCAP